MSLQSTADLLATTQTRLSSGKKVNSALDNPTSFFTASALDGRASDINNLLDSIGNGVQVLQAANTGISFLEKLVGNAKSVANQALQTTVGYSSKSSVTSAVITGATANNLLGDGDRIDRHRYGRQLNAQDTAVASPTRRRLSGAANTDSVDRPTSPTATRSPSTASRSTSTRPATTGSATAGTLELDIRRRPSTTS